VCLLKENLRNLPSFQQSIDHGSYSIEWHAWRSAVMPTFTTFVSAHSQFVGIKVALAGTDNTHNRFNPALAPDGQPIPGSAIFSPIPGTTRDFCYHVERLPWFQRKRTLLAANARSGSDGWDEPGNN